MSFDGKQELVSFQIQLKTMTHYLPGPSIFKCQKQDIFKTASELWRDENPNENN
jgi:hypothetical protein